MPASVRVIDVGKTPGHHAVPQSRINDILVEEAVRVEVVPGVTSAVAVPAAAGIPVTHRGVARGFTVVTGHDGHPGAAAGL